MSNNLLLYYPKTRPKSLLLAKKSFYIDKTDVENEILYLNVRIIVHIPISACFDSIILMLSVLKLLVLSKKISFLY